MLDAYPTLPHSGIAAVVGRTNAGKSTLVNKIVGEKISIVSPVVQTTRNIIRGILTEDRGQLVLIDTPGLHKSRSLLCTAMNKRARGAIEGADVVLLVVDASKSPQLEDDGWMRRIIANPPEKCFILLNKADVEAKTDEFKALWSSLEKEIAEQFEQQKAKAKEKGKEVVDKPLEKVVPVWFEGSAITGDGIDKLVAALFEALPPGPMLFDEEMITDYPRKLAVSDAVREEFFKILKNELPHSIGVFVEHLREPAPDVWRVEATVFVRRQNHKGIVIGQNGKNIRRVRAGAEQTISDNYGVKASIELNVKVAPDWDGNEHILRSMGCL